MENNKTLNNIIKINNNYKILKQQLKNQHLEEIQKIINDGGLDFAVGDFISSQINTVIKIQSIFPKMVYDTVYVFYSGKRYYKKNKKLIPLKNEKIDMFRHNMNFLKKIDTNIWKVVEN
jgi:hypothetical protein